jgi:hypothetical protein
MIALALARTVLKVWKHPFGRDVVPDVYTTRNPSSGDESRPAYACRSGSSPSTTRLSSAAVCDVPAERAT